MDIACDKNIAFEDLQKFLQVQFSDRELFLVYPGVNDWDDVAAQELCFEYIHNEDVEKGFAQGISLCFDRANMTSIIERLSLDLSTHFSCRTLCDASRILLKKDNPYYALMFEAGRVYLVDDCLFEETAEVSKVIELVYHPPEYAFNS